MLMWNVAGRSYDLWYRLMFGVVDIRGSIFTGTEWLMTPDYLHNVAISDLILQGLISCATR